MAVVGTAGAISSELSEDTEGHRTYTSIYQVITDDKLDGPLTARAAAGIPAIASGYAFGNDSDPWAFCIRRPSVRLAEGGDSAKKWHATVEHTTKPSKTCKTATIEDPLDQPPVISGSFVSVIMPAEKDMDGEPITNSADEPFIPAIEIEDHEDTLIYEINTATISLATRAKYTRSVNDAPLWGLPARCVRLVQWGWDVAYYGQCNNYIRNRLEFAIRPADRPWDFNILDQGTRIKIGFIADPSGQFDPSPIYDTVKDRKDEGLNGPFQLDGKGLQLKKDSPAVFLTKKVYAEQDYSALPIQDPLPGPF